MTGSTARRAAAVALAVVLALPAGLAGPAFAGHGHGPSARTVAKGRAAVATREQQVRRAAARVARTRAQVQRLASTAEVAVEGYDAARVREAAARQQVTAADVVLAAATRQLGGAERRVARFASVAYMSGGLSSVDTLLTAGGPQALLDRVGTLEVISRSQRDATESLDAARVYELAVARSARAALAQASSAARTAAAARARAQAAVAQQTAVLTALQQRQRQLAGLLQRAQAHASALERARLAAIARARALAAARARARQVQHARQATQQVGSTGPVQGTASASTELRAVHYAESQLGKPYVWGAAGPDSYDCSGLVMWAYAKAGVSLDHYTGDQWQEGARISTSAMRPGDLAFFATDTNDPSTIHHVGMYVGNGNMVEAPYTGANVRISSVWRPDLIGVIRPYAR